MFRPVSCRLCGGGWRCSGPCMRWPAGLPGLYRGIWLFASLPDLKRVLRAVALSTAAVLVFFVFFRDGQQSGAAFVAVLYPMLLVLYMGGGRAAYRMWKEHRLYGGLIAQGKPVVIVGAGRGGAMLVRELERSADWRVVGLVDDDRSKWGRELSGHEVLGGLESLPEVLASEKASHVILAMPSAAADACRRATDLAVAAGAHVFTVPGLEDVMSGRVAISSIRPVEIEDLLGREPVWIDTPHVAAMLAGKTVMVTGAGGSIGGELCRQLAHFGPARVVLFEQGEFALYTLEQWFALHMPDVVTGGAGGRCEGCGTPRRGVCRMAAAGGLPRGSVQACAADGGRQCLAGGTQQYAGHAAGRRVRGPLRCRALRADLDRQGGESDQRDGRDQAAGGDGLRGAAPPGRQHAVRDGALRQCAGQHG